MTPDDLAAIKARADAANAHPYAVPADYAAHAREDVPALLAEVERLRDGHGRQCSHDACDQEVAALRAEVERVTAASRAAQDDAYVCGRDEARAEVARLRDGILERYTEDGERIPGLTVIDGGYVSDLEAEVARLRAAVAAVAALCATDSGDLRDPDGLPVTVARDYAGEWARWSDVKRLVRAALAEHTGGAS